MCLEGRIRLICAWRRSRRMPPRGPHDRRPVPFMRGRTAAPALRPRHVPAFERERDHRGPRARRDVLSLVPDGLRVLLAGAIAAGRKTRTDFLRRLCLFFVLLGFLARSFEGILRADVPSPGTGTEISGRRNSEQRWLSAAVFQRIRNPRPWHRARRELRRSCAGERYRDADPVLWAGYRMSTRGGGSAGGPVAGEQRAGARSGHQRFRRRAEDCSQIERRRHHGIPTSAATHTTRPVRYDLSRTLFLPFARGGERDLRPAWLGHFRRRGTDDPRRLVADLCAARRGRFPCRSERGEPSVGGAAGRARPGLDVPRLRTPRPGIEAQVAYLPHPSEGGGKKGVGLWRTGKGQHAVELLRDQI